MFCIREDIADKREGTQFGDGAANKKGELQAIASDADRAERVGTPSTTGLSDEEGRPAPLFLALKVDSQEC